MSRVTQLFIAVRAYFVLKYHELRGALFLAYMMAMASFYAARALKIALGYLVHVPDAYLSMVATDKCTTTDGRPIMISSAQNSDGPITNKLKLFMQMYWKNAADTFEQRSGFRLQDYVNVFANEGLAICYTLLNTDGKQSAHCTWAKKKSDGGGEQETDGVLADTSYVVLDGGSNVMLNEWDEAREAELREMCNVNDSVDNE